MQRSYRIKTTVTKSGSLSIKGLPFKPGETVEVTVRRNPKKASAKAKYPLRGKLRDYREPLKSVDENDWEALK
ncbi:MAG: hypothetical protein IT314_01635 [Anaerolineales bacterium]|nr:hypothetical protein [Anaerolineales bacterium]